MKTWARFLIRALIATFIVYALCVVPVYLLVKTRLSESFEHSAFSYCRELVITRRQQILLQDVFPVYDSVSQVAGEKHVAYFNIIYADGETSFGRPIANTFAPTIGASFSQFSQDWDFLKGSNGILYYRTILYSDFEKNNPVATVTFGFSQEILNRDLRMVRFLFAALIILGCTAFTALFFILYRKLESRFRGLLDYFSKLAQGIEVEKSAHIQDFGAIVETADRLAAEVKESQEKIKLLRTNEALATLASQVAHDIRSPLSALNMVVGTLKEMPEDKRLVVRNASQRINDIANDLLNRSKTANAGQGSIREPVLLAVLVDTILSEKRTRFRDRTNVEIIGVLDAGYGLFAFIESSSIARALSNLIVNSVEAISNNGKVEVSMRREDHFAAITVADNGKGMHSNLVANLGERGVSFGKKMADSGSGLGFYQARKAVIAAEGSIKVESKLNLGTQVTILIPLCPPPRWFAQALRVPSPGTVVSVDDEQTFHDVVANRLSSSNVDRSQVKHQAFLSVAQHEYWWKTTKGHTNDALFLVDYEFSNHSENGLAMIENLGIEHQSVLVTSRHDDPSVRSQAERLGVKILPKSMMSSVPIEVYAVR